MVQILTGSLNPEDQSFKIRTKAIAISIAKPNIWKPDLQKVQASNVSRFQMARFQIPTVPIVVYFKDKFLTNFNSIFEFFQTNICYNIFNLETGLNHSCFPSIQFDNYGEPFGKGDSIGCHLDLDQMRISFTKNGVDLGQAFPIQKSQERLPFFPAIVLKVRIL